MAVFSDPFGALANFQQALDAFRASSWLDAGPSGGGGVVTALAACWRFECGVAEEHDENQLFRIWVCICAGNIARPLPFFA